MITIQIFYQLPPLASAMSSDFDIDIFSPEISLMDSEIPNFARSDNQTDIVNIFEIPALKSSLKHDRIAGYWDIKWLSQAKEGLEDFILRNNGKMRLLIGIPINKSTTRLLNAKETHLHVANQLINRMKESPSLSDWQSFDILRYMIIQKNIEIKIFVLDWKSTMPKAEHAKIQIYSDGSNNVGSSGSKNDTQRGNKAGVDFVTISKSWSSDDSKNQIQGMKEYFEDHWEHDDCFSLDEAAKNPDFIKTLESLSNEDDKNTDSLVRNIRKIGKTDSDTKSIVVDVSKDSNFDETMVSELVPSIVFDVEVDFLEVLILKLHEHLPNAKIGILQENDDVNFISDKIPPGVWCKFWEHGIDQWSYINSAGDTEHSVIIDLQTSQLDKKLLAFFEYSLIEDNSEEGKDLIVEKRHYLIPEIIENYPFGENLRPHHERSLIGLKESSIDSEGIISIEGGFLKTKRALFEHATGSGKTGLGLIAAAHMLDGLEPENNVDFVIISCPKISIARQWWETASAWFNSSKNNNVFWSHHKDKTPEHWDEEKKSLYNLSHIESGSWRKNYASKLKHRSILITVNNTFENDKSVKNLKSISNKGGKYGLIIDEAHKLVTKNKTKIKILNKMKPEWFLALTASFMNYNNEIGSFELLNWISKPNNRDYFSLESALELKYLKPYEVIFHYVPSSSKVEFKLKNTRVCERRIRISN
jgi:hypothetical protein